MKREIKFRGKRVDNKEWVHGYFVGLGHIMIFNSIDGYKQDDFGSRLSSARIISETVCQFTGLKDKNGVEIYEGDIFHLVDKNIIYTVVWHDTGLIGKQNGTSNYVGLEHWKKHIAIIGNIYDYPELLK